MSNRLTPDGGDRLTPDALRKLANTPLHPFWYGQAQQLLLWAADVLEAAQAVIAESRTDTTREPCDGCGCTCGSCDSAAPHDEGCPGAYAPGFVPKAQRT